MPCYRCGARQVDPVRGHSPWQRGVRENQQVLVCPGCQAAPGWTAELDECRQCGSVRLVRRLGEVECRQCGFVVPPEDGAAEDAPVPAVTLSAPAGDATRAQSSMSVSVAAGADKPMFAAGSAPGLAEEVALALERVLGRANAKRAAQAPLS
ncbi:MAG TPA: hypothetical protein VIV12_00010 [Streptosporangiaceae bacterium]